MFGFFSIATNKNGAKTDNQSSRQINIKALPYFSGTFFSVSTTQL